MFVFEFGRGWSVTQQSRSVTFGSVDSCWGFRSWRTSGLKGEKTREDSWPRQREELKEISTFLPFLESNSV